MPGKYRRTYTEEQRTIALIFLERLQNRPDAIEQAAKLSDVEPAALQYWSTGGGVHLPETPLWTPGNRDNGDPEADSDWEVVDEIPMPPEHLMSPMRFPEDIVPAPDLADWVYRNYIEETGELWNPDHAHLLECHFCWEWTNLENARVQKKIAAQTQLIAQSGGGKWDKLRDAVALRKVWGCVPTFRITVDSVWWMQAPDANRCALVDHELYHCGIKIGPKGPCFDRKTGSPVYALQGHDFEGFIGVMKRWGVDAAEGGAKEMIAASKHPPLIAQASIRRACGTCR